MKFLVCTWEPAHTLERFIAQEKAREDGTIARLVQKHGKGDELRSALLAAGLLTQTTTIHKDSICPSCGAMMDEVLGPPGVEDQTEALRDIANDLSAAIARTRKER